MKEIIQQLVWVPLIVLKLSEVNSAGVGRESIEMCAVCAPGKSSLAKWRAGLAPPKRLVCTLTCKSTRCYPGGTFSLIKRNEIPWMELCWWKNWHSGMVKKVFFIDVCFCGCVFQPEHSSCRQNWNSLTKRGVKKQMKLENNPVGNSSLTVMNSLD